MEGQPYDTADLTAPDRVVDVSRAKRVDNKEGAFVRKLPTRRHSQNDLRSVLDQELSKQEQDSEGFPSRLTHYASDADLKQHQFDPAVGWKALLNKLKVLPESVLSSPLLSSPPATVENREKGRKICFEEPNDPQAGAIADSPSLPVHESTNIRNSDSNQTVSSQIRNADASSSVPRQQRLAQEGSGSLPKSPQLRELHHSAQHSPGTPIDSLELRGANALSTSQSLGSFPSKVPSAPEQKRLWERASIMIRRILDDKASVAPTSVVSARSRSIISGRPGMRWNDSTYGYLPQFVKIGKAAATRELLAGGCNPGTQEIPRWQPIFAAVRGRSDKHNKFLIALTASGANVNARRTSARDGKSYLHYAISQAPWPGYSTRIHILLKAGANPNTRDKSENVPLLMLLIGNGPLKPEERKALLIILAPEINTEISVVDTKLDENVLHLAIRRKDPHTLDAILDRIGKDDSRKEMLQHRNASGFTPLLLVMNTCSFANEEAAHTAIRMLELLLENGANPNDADSEMGNAALHLVLVRHKHTEAFDLLIKFNASGQQINKQKSSPRRILSNKLLEKPVDAWYESIVPKIAHHAKWQTNPISAYRSRFDVPKTRASPKAP